MDARTVQDRVLIALAAVGMLGVVVLALVVAPPMRGFSPLAHRLFYFHVPSAWVAYVAFAVTAVASVRHLLARSPAADRWAAGSAEIGLLFAVIALVTGIAWSRVEFAGVYTPFRDPKVLTLVVVVLAYAAYLTLRAGVEDPAKRGRLAAVFGVLAFLTVPLSYLSSRVSVHPDFTREESALSPEIGMILGACLIAFTVLYAALARHRVRVLEVEDEVARLTAEVDA